MKQITNPSLLILTLTLAACGGDGGLRSALKIAPAPVTSPASAPAPAAVAVATATATATATAAPANSQTCGIANFQQELLNQINQARANNRMCGGVFYNAAAPVQWQPNLFNAAAGHSFDMASNNFFSHTSSNGASPGDRITRSGYSWGTFGENIAAGQPTIDAVMTAWINSPGHCENLMKANVTDVAVSCAGNDGSTYKTYWTMELARPL